MNTYIIITAVVAFALGLCAMRYYYNHLKNCKKEFFSMYKERPLEWRDTQVMSPYPGALVALKHEKYGVTFGYVVGIDGEIMVAELPKDLTPLTIDVEIHYQPLCCWRRWAYATSYIRDRQMLLPTKAKFDAAYSNTKQDDHQ